MIYTVVTGLAFSIGYYLLSIVWTVSNPALDIADLLIQASPGQLATWFIETLGETAKKLLAVTGIALLTLSMASIHWLVSRTLSTEKHFVQMGCSFALHTLVVTGLSVLNVQSTSTNQDYLTVVVIALVFGIITPTSTIGTERSRRVNPALNGSSSVSRRRMLSSAFALSVLTSVLAARLISERTEDEGQSSSNMQHMQSHPLLKDLRSFSVDFAQSPTQRQLVTPVDDFYTVDITTRTPIINVNDWNLSVTGNVEAPQSFSYEQILAMPKNEFFGTLQCISNEVGGPLIGCALWTGIPIRDILDLVQIKPGTKRVVLVAEGGYDDSIDIAKAMEADTTLAYAMNGTALTPGHGYPLRAYIPGIYGMKNVKWLREIRVSKGNHDGYWQRRGWSNKAIVKTTSAFDDPVIGSRVRLSSLHNNRIGGIAFAGNRGIAKVQYQTNIDDRWYDADLEDQLRVTTWRRWSAQTGLSPGRHMLRLRAIDGNGNVQDSDPAAPHPDGASGYHAVEFDY